MTDYCDVLGLNTAITNVTCTAGLDQANDLVMGFNVNDGALMITGDVDLHMCPSSAQDPLSITMDNMSMLFGGGLMDLTDMLPQNMTQNLILATNNERQRFGVSWNPLDTPEIPDLSEYGIELGIDIAPAIIVTPTLEDTTLTIHFEAEFCVEFNLPMDVIDGMLNSPEMDLAALGFDISTESINAILAELRSINNAGRVCDGDVVIMFKEFLTTIIALPEITALFGDLASLAPELGDLDIEDMLDELLAEFESMTPELGSWVVDISQLCSPEELALYQTQASSLEYTINAGVRGDAGMSSVWIVVAVVTATAALF